MTVTTTDDVIKGSKPKSIKQIVGNDCFETRKTAKRQNRQQPRNREKNNSEKTASGISRFVVAVVVGVVVVDDVVVVAAVVDVNVRTEKPSWISPERAPATSSASSSSSSC